MESTDTGGTYRKPARPKRDGDRPPVQAGRTSSTKYKGTSTEIALECKWKVGIYKGKVSGKEISKPCGRRWCPACGPRLHTCHVAHFTEVFRDLPSLYCATLTLDPKAFPAALSSGIYEDTLIETMWKPFRDSMSRACRKQGEKFTYVGAHERHGGGLPHIHALISCPIEGADELMEELWFQKGGGAVLTIEPLIGGERGVARWVGYMLKNWFTKAAPRNRRLLCSQDIGYYSKKAVKARRAHTADTGEAYTFEKFESDEPMPVREARKACPLAIHELTLSARSKQFVTRVDETPYYIRTTMDADGGARTYRVVQVVWDEDSDQTHYKAVSSHATRNDALASARGLGSTNGTTQ